jgi:hypothetical protein
MLALTKFMLAVTSFEMGKHLLNLSLAKERYMAGAILKKKKTYCLLI